MMSAFAKLTCFCGETALPQRAPPAKSPACLVDDDSPVQMLAVLVAVVLCMRLEHLWTCFLMPSQLCWCMFRVVRAHCE